MAAIAFDPPRWYPDTREKAPPRRYGTVANAAVSTGFRDGDFIVVKSSGIVLASLPGVANGEMSVSGLADHDSFNLYGSIATDTSGPRTPFGQTNPIAGTLQPFSSGLSQHYIYAGQFQLFEISLKEAWLATTANNTACGITVDSATGIYIATTTLTCATIIKGLDGPSGLGVVGDTGKRVVIQFLAGNVV